MCTVQDITRWSDLYAWRSINWDLTSLIIWSKVDIGLAARNIYGSRLGEHGYPRSVFRRENAFLIVKMRGKMPGHHRTFFLRHARISAGLFSVWALHVLVWYSTIDYLLLHRRPITPSPVIPFHSGSNEARCAINERRWTNPAYLLSQHT